MSKTKRVFRYLLLLGLAVSAAPPSSYGQGPDPLTRVEARLRAIYERREFAARSVRPLTWLPDGSGLVTLEERATGGGRELLLHDTRDGRRTVLLPAERFVVSGRTQPLVIEEAAASPDGARLLLLTDSRPDPKGSGRRLFDYWHFDRRSGALEPLVTAAERTALQKSFSPDGARFLYGREHNLYARAFKDGSTIPLTSDGVVDAVTNGVGSGPAWGPDGRSVVFVQSDSRAVALRPMLDTSDPTYPQVHYRRFARVGGVIPALRVGVVGADGGETRWLAVPGAPEGYYLGGVSFAGPDEVLIERLSRGRDARSFLVANLKTGGLSTLYAETDPAWVDASYAANAGLEWIRDGRAFVLLSEKGGWRQAYVHSRDGASPRLLTPGPTDVIARGRVVEAQGYFYYLASPENATQRYLYRVRLDGKTGPERVSPRDEPGTHSYEFSPDGRFALHTYSTYDTPPRLQLVELPSHRVISVLETNEPLRERTRAWFEQPVEFLKLTIAGGVAMDAWMIKPPGFDPSRKYPLFVFVYGEPHLQTVTDDWSGGGQNLFQPGDRGSRLSRRVDRQSRHACSERRRVAASGVRQSRTALDRRAGRGLARTGSAATVRRSVTGGHLGLERRRLEHPQRDVPEAERLPRRRSRWRRNRARSSTTPGSRKSSCARPRQNPDGYRTAAAINYAEGLKGRLLIMHGTGETNTHIQITEALVDRLIELGKRFDYMTYPNRDHGLSEGPGSTLHVRSLIARYLIENLPPGPRAVGSP